MTSKSNNRRGSHNVSTLQSMLSERDHEILRFVSDHRFATTRQIQRLLFFEHATVDAATRACNRVLTRLRDKRFIHRLDRQIGGVRGGSGSFVWCIGPAGDRIVRADASGTSTTRKRAYEPSGHHLNHTLAIVEVHLVLVEQARAGHIGSARVTTEPNCWRQFTGSHGVAVSLKPDLHAVTTAGEFEDHWFIEVDLGTESIPTLIRKCRTYDAYFRSGIEQARVGVFPVVIWLIQDPHRRERLEAAIRADDALNTQIFRVANTLDINNTIEIRLGDDE